MILKNIHSLLTLPKIMVWYRERQINVSGPEQRMPKYFTQALKSESIKTSHLRLLAEGWGQNEQVNAMLAVF